MFWQYRCTGDNFCSFYKYEKVFILPLFLKGTFPGYRILGR